MMMRTGIDTARHIESNITQVIQVVQIAKLLLDLLGDVMRRGTASEQ